MADKNNIFYKPEIDYRKQYDSVIESESVDLGTEDTDIPTDVEDNILDKIKNGFEDIESIKGLLPGEIGNIVRYPFEVVKEVIESNDSIDDRPDTSDVVTSRDPFDITDKEDEDREFDFTMPESPFREEEDLVTINRPDIDITESMIPNYGNDFLEIVNDYEEKLINIYNSLVDKVFMLLDEDVDLFFKVFDTYKIKTEDISKDYKHLSDTIIRSQITRNKRMRMYNKMFNKDKTIAHIRACKIGIQQRKRYYEENYLNANNVDNSISNKFLERNRMMYDEKYLQNFLNLYKYLNSSVIMLDECMNMFINEVQAKTILLKKEGKDLW